MSDTTPTATPAVKKVMPWKRIAALILLAAIAQRLANNQSMAGGVDWDALFGQTVPWFMAVLAIVLGFGMFGRRAGLPLVGLGALLLIWNVHAKEYLPEEAGVRVGINDANTMVVQHAQGVRGQLAKANDHKRSDGTVDLDTWWSSRKPKYNEIAKARNLRDAGIARVTRRIPVHRQPLVRASQMAAVTYFPAYEPILVVISPDDQICSGSRPTECSRADGTYKSGLPEMHRNKKTVLQTAAYGGREGALSGNYHAHIARVCDNGVCGEWVETGFVYAVCRPGNEQQWTNGFAQIGNLVHAEDFFGGMGYYSFDAVAHPLAVAACDANPDADIVPNLDPPLEELDPGSIPVIAQNN